MTVRQKLYGFNSFDELRYAAVLGTCFGTGEIPDISYINKFGLSGTLTAGVEEDVWSQGGTYTRMTSAETMDIVSTSANDAPSGTGIDSIFIRGLDGDYEPINETITLNGVTSVETTNSYLFIYRMEARNNTATGTTNDGTITATASTAATVQGHMPAGDSTTNGSHFLVPNGYSGLVTDLHLSIHRVGASGLRRAIIDLRTVPTSNADKTNINYRTIRLSASNDGGLSVNEFHNPLVIPEKTLFYLTVNADSNNTQLAFEYDVILVKTVVDIDSVF